MKIEVIAGDDRGVARGNRARDRVPRPARWALGSWMPAMRRGLEVGWPWWAVDTVLAIGGRRRGRRTALRGVGPVVVAEALVRHLATDVGGRRWRRVVNFLPLHVPSSSEPPSLYAASAVAFAVSVGTTEPVLGLPMAGLATAVLRRRIMVGGVGDVLAGGALGAAVAMAGNRLVPSRTPSPVRTVQPWQVPQPPRHDGTGVVAVVNPHSGGGRGARMGEVLRRELPGAQVVTPTLGADVHSALRQVASGAEVFAVCGGDGTVAAAARVAIDADMPLLVLPGGTFNHSAADIGIERVSDALAALRHGTAIRIDVGLAGQRLFLNTSSLGSYPAFVAIRERWERRVGKPVAAVIALLVATRQQRPLHLVVDGRAHHVAMMFLGNCRYQPHGFAPRWRPRLDDGRLDLRMVTVDGRAPLARLAVALLTGRLGRSRLYIEDDPVDLHVSMPDGAGELATDGEIRSGHTEISYTKLRRSLTVYQPPHVSRFPG
jgi:diacylglycerol kinase family enzyme